MAKKERRPKKLFVALVCILVFLSVIAVKQYAGFLSLGFFKPNLALDALARLPGKAFDAKAIFRFKAKDELSRWKEKVFKGRVLYTVKIDKNEGFLSASSNSSASGIFYKVSFDPKKEPFASWKWKVIKFPDKNLKGQTESKWIEKDDYAARFYFIFPRLSIASTRTIEYVWDKDLPSGTVMASPYFKNIKIIVLESGENNLGEWVSEERNIYADYKAAFGQEPTKVGAIAIMTDTDNTLSSAEANYDEINVGYKKQEVPYGP